MVAGIAHLVTSLAYYVIGGVLIWLAMRLWFAHPVNRVFMLGEYLTEKGLRLVLRLWPFVFLFGAFIFSCGIDHTLDHFHRESRISHMAFDAVAITEAVISLWTAGSVVWVTATWRRWREK